MTVGELRKKLEGVPDDYKVELEYVSGVCTMDAEGTKKDNDSKELTIF